ncbi:MAG: hypothetical protein ABIA37_05240 [Candidatus Woesearchaeota archaeon]
MFGHAFRNSVLAILATVAASVLLVILSIIYFGIILWVVKTASKFFFGEGLETNWAVLSAAVLTAGSIIAGSMRR